ncbi:MAG: RNA signal recognition particle [Elusimicrobia bacterium GWC2_64_44]|nr:MAG: RNA signal recognition particle [Elusimicrobia bacterium GWC2_64_44]
MSYVDGYVLAVPKKKLAAYRVMARQGEKAWRKHGVLDYKECSGDDLKPKWGVPFTRMMKCRPGETVVFSFIVYKSRAHRDRVNAKVMKDMEKMPMPKDVPFDMKRMVYGGFKTLVGD